VRGKELKAGESKDGKSPRITFFKIISLPYDHKGSFAVPASILPIIPVCCPPMTFYLHINTHLVDT
jgi:hypothetical protein